MTKISPWLLLGGGAIAAYIFVPQVKEAVNKALVGGASSTGNAAGAALIGGITGAATQAGNEALGLFQQGGLFSNSGAGASIIRGIENAITGQNQAVANVQSAPSPATQGNQFVQGAPASTLFNANAINTLISQGRISPQGNLWANPSAEQAFLYANPHGIAPSQDAIATASKLGNPIGTQGITPIFTAAHIATLPTSAAAAGPGNPYQSGNGGYNTGIKYF